MTPDTRDDGADVLTPARSEDPRPDPTRVVGQRCVQFVLDVAVVAVPVLR